ncbi:MAG: type II toxin-antitoxin system RelE/ParE family toxin [Anaerolineae bacterium]|nr:type II toxin-antitoxin system RelE/ParE family toxin [Anaerolineales bacterium]MCQ3979552.1 type II toxin-antitoxin system RelE/ParE family toxin [Anaerolineae bacterium]
MADELRRLPREHQDRIVARINSLGTAPRPRGIVQLEPGVYRLRVGDYRIIYQVIDRDQVVLIIHVRRRREDTYKNIVSAPNRWGGT